MIFLSGHNQINTLDEAKILKLAEMIGVDRSSKYYQEFCQKPDNNFYDFFHDLLIGQSPQRGFKLDWKWNPIDTEKLLDSEQLISIYFGDESYNYLVVPKDFDIERFMSITGLERTTPEIIASLRPRYDVRHPNLEKDFRQPEKLLFLPIIIYIEDDHTAFSLRYRKLRKEQGEDVETSIVLSQPWTGYILPGQTTEEGVANKLKEELSYVGRFDYNFAGYEGTTKDEQGKDIHRYSLGIFIYDKTFVDITESGYKIELHKIRGFDANLFKRNIY